MSSWIKPWFIQQRSSGTPISGPPLQEKAKHFSTQLNTEAVDREFKASTGWLEKFKTRHGIRNLSTQGEKLSAAEETVEPFLQKLHKVIEEKNLIPEQIYNADETGLLWKCLPQRTLVSCREKSAPGFKKAKDRLTVLVSGHLATRESRHQGTTSPPTNPPPSSRGKIAEVN